MASYTDEQRQEAIDRAGEVGVNQAATELGVPQGTLSRWRREAGLEDSQPSGKGQAGSKGSKGKKSGSAKVPSKDDLRNLLTLLGVQVWIFDSYCGERIQAGASDLADALHDLARQNKAVAAALNALVSTSAWGALASAAATMLVPIAEHHGLVSDGAHSLVGAPPPPARHSHAGAGAGGDGLIDANGQQPDTPTSPFGTVTYGPVQNRGGHVDAAGSNIAATPDGPPDDGEA